MKTLFQSLLDFPLMFVFSMLGASMITWTDLISRDWLSFGICFVLMWILSYLRLRFDILKSPAERRRERRLAEKKSAKKEDLGER